MNKVDSCSAIICWRNKLLLFHRDDIPEITDPDCWHPPGGARENNETPLQAIRRELKEEVSYVPKDLKYITKIRKNNGEFVNLYYAFVNDNEAMRFKLGLGEGQEIAFFGLDEMEKMKLTQGFGLYFIKHKSILKKAMKTQSVVGFSKILLKF